jgi:hypothetical protein
MPILPSSAYKVEATIDAPIANSELQKIDASQWAKIRREYDQWIKKMQTNPLMESF